MQDPSYQFPVLGGDSGSYFYLTQNLKNNGVFSFSSAAPFIPESFRLPGYPSFLYLFTFLPFSYVTAMVVQMILAAASPVILYKLGKKFLSEKGALIAALLFCFEPTSVMFSTIIMSDTLFVFAMLLGIYLFFLNQKNFKKTLVASAIAGLLFGYAILVRVIAQYLAVCIIAAYLFVFHKELKPFLKTAAKIGIFLFGMTLVIFPWALRNHAQFHTYTLSATPYLNFTQYNLVYFYAYQHHITPAQAQHVFLDPIPYPWGSLWFGSLINEALFKKEIADGLRGNLVPYAEFHLIKTIPFFVNDSLRDINRMVNLFPQPTNQVNFTDLLLQKNWTAIARYFVTAHPDLWFLLVGSTVWISITILCLSEVVYTLLKRRDRLWFVLFASGVILYFAILSSPVIQPRYRMPAVPFMLLLAADAGVWITAFLRRQHNKLS